MLQSTPSRRTVLGDISNSEQGFLSIKPVLSHGKHRQFGAISSSPMFDSGIGSTTDSRCDSIAASAGRASPPCEPVLDAIETKTPPQQIQQHKYYPFRDADKVHFPDMEEWLASREEELPGSDDSDEEDQAVQDSEAAGDFRWSIDQMAKLVSCCCNTIVCLLTVVPAAR